MPSAPTMSPTGKQNHESRLFRENYGDAHEIMRCYVIFRVRPKLLNLFITKQIFIRPCEFLAPYYSFVNNRYRQIHSEGKRHHISPLCMLCREHITDSNQAVKRKHKEEEFTEMLFNKENLGKL